MSSKWSEIEDATILSNNNMIIKIAKCDYTFHISVYIINYVIILGY